MAMAAAAVAVVVKTTMLFLRGQVVAQVRQPQIIMETLRLQIQAVAVAVAETTTQAVIRVVMAVQGMHELNGGHKNG
jgi:hypothetical protein